MADNRDEATKQVKEAQELLSKVTTNYFEKADSERFEEAKTLVTSALDVLTNAPREFCGFASSGVKVETRYDRNSLIRYVYGQSLTYTTWTEYLPLNNVKNSARVDAESTCLDNGYRVGVTAHTLFLGFDPYNSEESPNGINKFFAFHCLLGRKTMIDYHVNPLTVLTEAKTKFNSLPQNYFSKEEASLFAQALAMIDQALESLGKEEKFFKVDRACHNSPNYLGDGWHGEKECRDFAEQTAFESCLDSGRFSCQILPHLTAVWKENNSYFANARALGRWNPLTD